MRFLLVPALVLSLGVASVQAAEDAAAPAAAAPAAVNTIDPVTGGKVDAKIAPVEAKTKDGKTILIGAETADSAAKIKADPAKYVDAAIANKAVDAK
jgi:hypothetical protein